MAPVTRPPLATQPTGQKVWTMSNIVILRNKVILEPQEEPSIFYCVDKSSCRGKVLTRQGYWLTCLCCSEEAKSD
jgi:hypothetical protein